LAKKAAKRAEIIAKLAVHFLSSGLDDTGLRRLAEVAGTSDRMLLYYFENKDELVLCVLDHIGAGLSVEMARRFGQDRKRPAELVEALWGLVKDPFTADQVRLWLDLSSRASRNDPLFQAVAEAVSENWIKEIAALLDVEKSEQRPLAILIMAAVDGQLFLFPNAPEKGDEAIARLIHMLEPY